MKKSLAVINELKEQGIIEDYAIGGGIAAIYYIEPILTYDLGIFVILPRTKGKKVIDMTLLYESLQKKGCLWQRSTLL